MTRTTPHRSRPARHAMLAIVVRSALGASLLASLLVVIGQPEVRIEQRYAAASERLEMSPASTILPGDDASALGISGPQAASAEVSTRDFTTIGLSVADLPIEPVALRWRSSGVWSPWHLLDIEPAVGPDDTSAEAGRVERSHGDTLTSEPVWIGHGDGYQFRGGAELAGLAPHAVLVHPDGVETVAQLVQPAAGADTFGRPPIHPRSDWGARAPTGSVSSASSLKIAVVHHADTANDYSPGDVPGILRSIQAFHIQGRGWSDIGYNFAVDKYGGMWEGRSGSLDGYSIGAHASGFNTASVGIVALGNYETAAPTSDLIASIGEVVAWRFANAFIDPTSTVAFTSAGSPTIPTGQVVQLPRVLGHRDIGATDCPGRNLYNQLSQIRLVVNGKTAEKASPFGVVEIAGPGPNAILVQGWAIDPSTTSPIEVHVYIDAVGTNLGPANGSRPDLTGPFPYFGPQHGFQHVFSGVSPGAHNVCVFAINLDLGSNTLLNCSTVAVVSGPPIGAVERVAPGPDGTIFVSGWAYDPDSYDHVDIRVVIDGRDIDAGVASASHASPAVPALYGGARGFDFITSGLSTGIHRVCVTAVNIGPGTSTPLGCSDVSAPSGSPFGHLDVVSTGPDGTVRVSGWAIDPDVSASIPVHVYIDSLGFNLGPTPQARPDLAAAFPGYGAAHGFTLTTTGIAPGLHRLCAYGINSGVGSNAELGCQPIIVPGGPPIGVLDVANGAPNGTLAISGWALDPDTSAPIQVHVYVDGRGTNLGPTAVLRNDVASLFAGWGPLHGFSWTTNGLAAGTHSVCAFGIDSGGGPNTLLRCTTVNVPGGSPFGVIDSVRSSGSTISVDGWAIDPDVTAPIQIHVYIDGAGFNTGTTTVTRGDVAAANPPYGTGHGYSWTRSFAAGAHNVCIFAINVGAGVNTLLGCRLVTTV